MENKNEINLSNQLQTGAIGWLSVITVLVFIGLAGYMGYYFYEKFSLAQNIKGIETQIADAQSQIDVFKRKNEEAVFVARKLLEEVESKEIVWSQAIKRLIDDGPEGVLVSSYAGTETGDLVLTAFAPSFAHVANAIKVLSGQKYYAKVFVPSLSKGVDAEGNTMVSFSVRLKYVEEEKTSRKPTETVTK